jgi:hypothetical protein
LLKEVLVELPGLHTYDKFPVPPLATTVAVPVLVPQPVWVEVADAVTAVAGWLIVADALALQLYELVTVTV